MVSIYTYNFQVNKCHRNCILKENRSQNADLLKANYEMNTKKKNSQVYAAVILLLYFCY